MRKDRARIMHSYFGDGPEDTCRHCDNCISIRSCGKPYRKCVVWGVSASEASDWKLFYPACGMFNKKYEGIPVKDLVKGKKILDEETRKLPGQMFMEELR